MGIPSISDRALNLPCCHWLEGTKGERGDARDHERSLRHHSVCSAGSDESLVSQDMGMKLL